MKLTWPWMLSKSRSPSSKKTFNKGEKQLMWKGIVESIYTGPDARGPLEAREQAVATPGVGLEGDRYALKQGTFFKPEPDFELTLIEAEAIEALRREYDVELAPGEARRNIVTRGVNLNHLAGR